VLTLADHREVRFIDPRRFGVSPSTGQAGILTNNGQRTTVNGHLLRPRPRAPHDLAGRLRRALPCRKTPIKAALLNQSLLHGVGNIYADESLFRAGIRPRRQAGRLTRAELIGLRTALQAVLRRAIKLGGSSVSDYVNAEGMRGYFQIEHKVYGRAAESCTVCATPIQKITLAGRGTHFCPCCQK